MSDYISREAMSETPKCPYCGDRMHIHVSLITPEWELLSAQYRCVTCGSTSPRIEFPGDMANDEIIERLQAVSSRRAEPKNRVLTLEEATGSDEPVWLEAMSRVFIADVCVAPDARMAQIQTIGKASCEYLPLCDYGVLWRCWLRKPTEAERLETPWEGDSHE